MAVGDRFDGVHLTWREWYGGAQHTSHGRACVGSIEHVGVGWVLIRRPRGGLTLKRLTQIHCWDGRLAARRAPGAANLLDAWCGHDSLVRSDRDARRAEGRRRRAQQQMADREAALLAAPAGADECPY